MTNDESNLRTAPQEIVELGDHLPPRRLLDLAANVFGALDQKLRHPGVGADVLEQSNGLPAVAPPQPRAQALRRARRRHAIEVHQARLVKELVANFSRWLAVPALLRIGQHDAQVRDL